MSLYLCCPVGEYRPCDVLLPCPSSPTNCVQDEETDRTDKAQQKAVEPLILIITITIKL
jgi:hypothetical protein